MKIIIALTMFVILFCPAPGFSNSPTLTEANQFFQQAVDTEDAKKAKSLLDKALLRYEQLYRDHPAGRLAYNIGNTYYQMDNKPMALVYYKRAFKDIPADPNLLHNMELVRQELHLDASPPQTDPWLPDFVHTHRLPLFLGLYSLFWVTASIRYTKKRLMPLAIPVILLLLTLASSTIIGMELLQPDSQEGVITTDDTMGRQGNGRNFEPSFSEPLPSGTEFQVLEKRGYWLRIKLNQNEECWIPTRSCEIV